MRRSKSNGLGGNDVVLLVAVDDHRYGWWETQATGLPGSAIDTLMSDSLDSKFRAGDYAGGVIDFADALGRAVLAGPNPTPAATGSAGSPAGGSTSSGDLGGLLIFLAVILIFVGVVIVVLRIRAWRLSHLSAEERDKQTGELARQANKLLVDTDDAITAAKQELGFAQAEFSDADCAPFAAALDKAQDELKAAFTLRQQLDDSTPEDPPAKIQMYNEIIAHCQAASGAIDEQAQAAPGAARPGEDRAPGAGGAGQGDRRPPGSIARRKGRDADAFGLRARQLGGGQGQRRGGGQAGRSSPRIRSRRARRLWRRRRRTTSPRPAPHAPPRKR